MVAAKKTKGKKKKINVNDKTKGEAKKAKAPEVAPVDAAQAAFDKLSDEEKAQLMVQMGVVKRKANGAAKARQQFKVAQESLYDAMPKIQAIIDECEFPAPFSLSVGHDHEGNFNASLKRLRKREKKNAE